MGDECRAITKGRGEDRQVRNSLHPSCCTVSLMNCNVSNRPPPNGIRRWGQGRLLEIEEEDYFNADDEEDEILPVLNSPSLPRTTGHVPVGIHNNNTALRRKRTRPSGIPIRPPSRQPLAPRTPPLGSLVDYDDSDDLGVLGPMEEYTTAASLSPTQSSPSPSTPPGRQLIGGLASNIAAIFPGSPVPSQQQPQQQHSPQETLTGPRLSGHHRPIVSSSPKLTSPIPVPTVPSMASSSSLPLSSPLSPSSTSPIPPLSAGVAALQRDETDEILESLVFGNSGPPSPSLVQAGRPFELGGGLGGLKRRRDDEDEEMMERLVNKSKRSSVFSKEKKGFGGGTGGGGGHEGVVRIGSVGLKGSESGSVGGVGGGGIGGGGHTDKGSSVGGGGGNIGGPKKIKIQLTTSNIPSTTTPSPSPSNPGTKDGDGG